MSAKMLVAVAVILIVFEVPLGNSNALKSKIPEPSGRIVGGVCTCIEHYPYQVALLLYDRQMCGGSIISSCWILTAAHCIIDRSSAFKIRAGSSDSESGGETIGVSQLFVHPRYDNDTHDYDIALLKLSKDITVENASPIKLPTSRYTIPDGALATITGWGALGEDKGTSKNLQMVQVPVISRKECSDAYSQFVISERMFCAGFMKEGGKDSCFGDSGGPVVVGNVQAGIVSWGEGCARANHPGVYTNVHTLRSWINEISGV